MLEFHELKLEMLTALNQKEEEPKSEMVTTLNQKEEAQEPKLEMVTALAQKQEALAEGETEESLAEFRKRCPGAVVGPAEFKEMKRRYFTNFTPICRPKEITVHEEDTTNEHHRHYMDLIRQSEGYYTPKVPDSLRLAATRPARIHPEELKRVAEFTKNALDWYKKENKVDENYELVKMECGTRIVRRGLIFKFAFIARDVESGIEVPFRAQVHFEVGGIITVINCYRAAESCKEFLKLQGRCCLPPAP